MDKNTYTKLSQKKGQIAILIDPENSFDEGSLIALLKKVEEVKVDFIFIGGSTVSKEEFETTIAIITKHTQLPVVIFPGSHHQISEKADALLYLSLLSGRNPDYLIGHHVQSASELIKMNLEVIPTGYILIDGGNLSTVAYVSQTTPIPRDQVSIIKNTAIAGVLQGKKILYFDAGSGAKNSIPPEIIKELLFLETPIIVGGGIKSIKEIENLESSGVNVIVIGNHIEENSDFLDEIKIHKEKPTI